MKYHHCLIKHDPPNSYGDCLRACVASLMNFENAEDVPHFARDDDTLMFERFKSFVYENNHRIITCQYSDDVSLKELLNLLEINANDVPYILIGDTENGSHAVIGRGGKILHNPAWYPAPMIRGCLGVWTIVYIVPVNND